MKVDWVPLGDLLDERRPTAVMAGERYPIAGVFGFGRGMLFRDEISGAETKYGSLTRVHSGDVVYSKLKAFEGAIAIANERADGYFVSPEFPVFSVDALVRLRYLAHLLASEWFGRQLKRLSTRIGARRERVHPSQFKAIQIPLPSKPDQERIAAHLDSLATTPAPAATDLRPILPRVLTSILLRAGAPAVTLGELCQSRHDVIHPGESSRGATQFVGLEHIESHTGRRIGGRAIGEQSGRKQRFEPGDVTYGYLRPYLNKAWAADETGLCSVEQFVLRPSAGVSSDLLQTILTSSLVLEPAVAATNNLQLPRLGLASLLQMRVPDLRGHDAGAVTRDAATAISLAVAATNASRRCESLAASVLPAARNEIFNALR